MIMIQSKYYRVSKYNIWFAAGRVKSLSIVPKLVIPYDEKYTKWYYHFGIEVGWFLWNVGVFFKHSEL